MNGILSEIQGVPGEPQGSPGFQRLFLIFLFFAIPVFLAILGNGILAMEVEDSLKLDAENRLDDAINKIEADKDPVLYLSGLFNRVERKVFSGDTPIENWKKVVPILRKRFAGSIETFVLDGSGNPVKEWCDRLVPAVLAKKFFESYRAFLFEKRPLSEVAQSFMRSFMGQHMPIDRVSHGFLNFAVPPPRIRYVYFSRPHPQGMFMIFLSPNKPMEEIVLRDQTAQFNRSGGPVKLCVTFRHEKAHRILQKLSYVKPLPVSFWQAMRQARNGKRWFDETLLAHRQLFPRLGIAGCVQTKIPTGAFEPALRAAMLTLLALGFFGFLLKTVLSHEDLFHSVRFKLLIAFLYAVLVPLITMGMTARSFLKERRVVLENETHQRVERGLLAFDRLFERQQTVLMDALKNHFIQPDFTASNSFHDFLERFETYRQRYLFDFCRIYDRDGNQRFEFYDPDLPSVFGAQLKLLPKLTKTLMARFYQESALPFQGGSPKAQERSSGKGDSFLAYLNFPYSLFSMLEFHAGSLSLFFSSLPLSDSDEGRLTHMAYFFWYQNKLEWRYIGEKLPSMVRNLRIGDILAWAPGTPELRFPQSFRYACLVNPVLGKVIANSTSFRRVVQHNGLTLLLTGIRGTQLKHFSFLAVTPDLDLQAEIRHLSWKFQFISLALLGACTIIVFLLSRVVLGPLGDLSQGMEAISRRDFSMAIPVNSEDELGRLAGLFNDTLEDLKDLEVARTVQETLFPHSPLDLGRWEIYGTCQPASQVGGDYFDYFPIDENRALLIIGDVSGHGVGAALVVAMAKAIIGHPSTSGKPYEILVSMNTILYSILKRKKMMSCCLALLDQKAGTITMANAGHNFPILLKEGSPKFFELRGFPLGSVRNWRASTQTYDLPGREIILFYTDGLIEAKGKDGNAIGYDRFLQDLPGLVGTSAVATEQAIRAWYRRCARDVPLEDDISIIVVQEKKIAGDSVA